MHSKPFWASVKIAFVATLLPLHLTHARTVPATVVDVHDGDTIAVTLNAPFSKAADAPNMNKRQSIRLLGMDTPETYYMGQDQGEHAIAAREELRALLKAGDQVILDLDTEETDRYKRILAHVFKGAVHVNKFMVEKGWAVNYVIAPNIKYSKPISDAVVEAQKKGLGIWDNKNPLPELPYDFRHRVAGTGNTRYVGNTNTLKFYRPTEDALVKFWLRIFFPTQKMAKDLGYSLGNPKLTYLYEDSSLNDE